MPFSPRATLARARRPSPRRARGAAALPIVLVLIVALLLVAVWSSQSNVAAERMSSNQRDNDLAQQAAEAALRAGEAYASANLAGPANGASDCSGSVCWLGDNDYKLSLTGYSGQTLAQAIWPASGASILDSDSGPSTMLPAGSIPGVAAQPRYLVEVIGMTKPGEDGSTPLWAYRVSAKGYGASRTTAVVLQSVFFRPPT